MMIKRRALLLSASALALGGAGQLVAPSPSGTLSSGGLPIASRAGMAWRPPSRLGINIIYTQFWNDGTGNLPAVPNGQYGALLYPYGVSFVRGLVNYYTVGGGVTSVSGGAPGAHFAVRTVLSVEPYAADPTKLVLTCSGSTYAVESGETLVLSQPITYTDAVGTVVTLPAQTSLTCAGGTAGSMTASYPPTSNSTIIVPAGATLVDNGALAVSGAQILHANFYRVKSHAILTP